MLRSIKVPGLFDNIAKLCWLQNSICQKLILHLQISLWPWTYGKEKTLELNRHGNQANEVILYAERASGRAACPKTITIRIYLWPDTFTTITPDSGINYSRNLRPLVTSTDF